MPDELGPDPGTHGSGPESRSRVAKSTGRTPEGGVRPVGESINRRITFLANLAAISAVLVSVVYTFGAGGAILELGRITSFVDLDRTLEEMPTWILIAITAAWVATITPVFLALLFKSQLIWTVIRTLWTWNLARSIEEATERLASVNRDR